MAVEGLSARLYLDQNANKQLAIDLRTRGYDVMFASEVGLERASDEEHLRFASESGRMRVTHDLRDFPRLAVE